MTSGRPSIWWRIHAFAVWGLIVMFGLFAVIHLGLTVAHAVGAWDTGVGYVLDWEVPAWLITVIDGTAALLLWQSRRPGRRSGAGVDLAMASTAGLLMVGRAAWMPLVPLFVTVAVVGATARLLGGRVARAA